MVAFGNRDNPRVVDDYVRALHEIMAENGIAPVRQPPDHIVTPDATLSQVAQYTDWYIADRGGGWYYPRPANPRYRYNRYISMLRRFRTSDYREAHVDIGCGPGLFSWAFLDWATNNGIGYNDIDLYGLDHSPAMVELARMIRDKLVRRIADYPNLSYFSNVESVLREVEENHRQGTRYTITLGHVLVQAHAPDNIRDFTQVITRTVRLRNPLNACRLIAVDAVGRAPQFAAGWQALLDSLEQSSVRPERLVTLISHLKQ